MTATPHANRIATAVAQARWNRVEAEYGPRDLPPEAERDWLALRARELTPVVREVLDALKAAGLLSHTNQQPNQGDTMTDQQEMTLPEWMAKLPRLHAAFKQYESVLSALDHLLEQTVDQDLKHGITLTEGEAEARKKAIAALADARGQA